MSVMNSEAASGIRDLILQDIDLSKPPEAHERDSFWSALRKTGTELWLDTGDLDEAGRIWSAEMSALTTNNTLLNREIQKGIYDDFVRKAGRELGALTKRQKVVEIAFILNARHGLRLVQRFGGDVSVELHTDLADDLEGIVAYGKRFHDVSPDHFIVKVPFTATGLLGARELRRLGIRVNFTLEFSARQNVLATVIAKPNYVNVFLSRLNLYVSDNDLGDGRLVGERATIASQIAVRNAASGHEEPTKQIAASLRSAKELGYLAGLDVFTMPTKVAEEARKNLAPDFRDRTNEHYEVKLSKDVDPASVRIETLWDVDEKVWQLAKEIDNDPPATGKQVEELAWSKGVGELFPRLSQDELATIAQDGKIPVHATWQRHIAEGEAAIDSLLNRAGLASFSADQADLDHRIEGLI